MKREYENPGFESNAGRDNGSDQLNRVVLQSLIDETPVDAEQLISVLQLMVIPEFDGFFRSLVRINLDRSKDAGKILTACADSLARPEFDIDEIWNDLYRNRALGTPTRG